MLTPKYQIGQRVYFAKASYSAHEVPCPDCLGQKEWFVTTPACETFAVPCDTCSRGFSGPKGTVDEYRDAPEVVPLTIGSVRTDTADVEYQISYMATETGVGGGNIYKEADLYLDKSAALAAAAERATEAARSRQARADECLKREKHKSKRKPSWEQRRIRELEREVRELHSQLKDKTP